METNYGAYYKMKLQNEWGTFIDLKVLPVSYIFLWCPPQYLGDPIRWNGGIHAISCKLRNTRNTLKHGFTEYSVFDLNWTDEKAEAILKIQFSYCLKPHYGPYDGFESHLEGWRVRYHGNLMSDNFHKTAVLKKKTCELKLDRIVLPINWGRTCA